MVNQSFPQATVLIPLNSGLVFQQIVSKTAQRGRYTLPVPQIICFARIKWSLAVSQCISQVFELFGIVVSFFYLAISFLAVVKVIGV